MTYEDSIDLVNKHLSVLKSKFGISVIDTSWVNEAIILTKDLIEARGKISEEEYFKREEYLYDKTVTALAELTNLREILNSLEKIDKENIDIFLKKIKIVFSAPLLIRNENSNSSEGRNTMFELRIFSRLISKEYKAVLHSHHPDISVSVNGNDYSIECKRIFKKETLISNTKAAIDQLLKYSLTKPGYGIVALSITRYFHSGDKRLEGTTEMMIKKRIEYEMDMLLKNHRDELLNIFPLKIPALFLEFTDRAVADKAYSMNLIDIIETANGRMSLFYKVRKDFDKLIS